MQDTKTILVIEDEPELLEALSEMLAFEGYQVIRARDGIEGIEQARKHIPDLILCDILMPGMDGFEVLQNLKKDLTTALIPFIFLTALSEQNKVRSGMSMGADDYIVKPFLRRELLDAIQSRFNKSALFEEHARQNMEKLRRNIISFLPHELITPLNGIISFGEIIREHSGSLTAAEISEMGSYIAQSGNRFYDLVQKYLLYIRITVNKDTGYTQRLIDDTRGEIENICRRIAENYERSGDLEMNLTPASLFLSTEEFTIIVKELTDNAFKFSVPGSKVTVETSVTNDVCILRVTDTGRGITRKMISEIGAFMQFDRDQHEQQGIGLGLFLVRQIAELNQGSLLLESEPGVGTTVTCSIPVTR